MRIDKTLVVVLLIILATAIANAEDLEPTVQITSNPELNATSSAVITIIATDLLENAGIEKIDFYINGAWEYTKQCGASTCTLTRTIVKTQPAFEIYKAIATDKGGNIGISPLINISYRGVNSPPTITTLPNITILEDSGMNGNLTDLWQYASDTWTEDSNLVYSIISQTNTSMANCLIDANRYINCTTVTGNATGFTNITISVSDGIFVKNSTFSLEVENVNDLPELIQPIPNLSLNEDTSNLTINLSQYFKDIDGPSIEYEFISNTTALNAFVVNISGTLFLNLSSNNNYNGQQNLTIIANDSLNQTNTTIIVTVFPVNDAPYFNPSLQNQTAIQDILFAYDINASDIDQGDILTYTDNSSLFTIDPSTGLISFTPLISGNRTVNITVCDDSGEPNDCTNEIFNLEIIYIPRPGFGNSTPLNATYTETAYYELFIDIINSSTIDTVLFEFNNANITAAQVSGNRYKTNLTNLPVGAYNYRWHANYTNTLSNSSILYTFTILPATTILTLNAPNATIVYGIKTNINCTSNTQQAIPTLYQNGTATTNPEITQLPAGSYNYTCSVPATQNYTTAEQTAYFNINKANTTMTLNAPITEAYGTTTNINCSINNNQSTLQLLRDGNPVVNPEITQLAAGYYNYTCNAPESQNYTAVIQTKFVNITKQTTTLILNVPSSAVYGTTTNANYTTNNNQATIQFLRDGNPVANPEIIQLGAGNYNYTCDIPETQNYTSARQTNFLTITQQTPVLGLYLNGTDANFYDKINTTVFLNGTINLPGEIIYLFLNNTLVNSGVSPLETLSVYNYSGWYNVTVTYPGTPNYTAATKTNYVIIGSPLQKTNFNPPSGSNLNQSYFTLSFNTNTNTTCRWDFTDLDYNSMANTFSTTGLTTHSGTITGLFLGTNNIYAACINDTASTNADLNYNVENIIEQGSTLTNGAIATGSIIYSTTLDNSIITNTNATNSTLTDMASTNSKINNSILTNCTVINSTVKDYTGSNCYIANSIVDPSDVTGSTVNSSTIMNSNATNSYIDQSSITDSNIDQSTIIKSIIQNSKLINITMTNTTVTNTNLQDAVLLDAIINAGVITTGIITQGNTTYNATENGASNLSTIINLPPTASFTATPSTTTPGTTINFDASSTTDPNIGQPGPYNDTTITYNWNFGEGNTSTGQTTTHSYNADGTYIVSLTATDYYGLNDTTTQTITISTSASPPPSNPPPGGGGGGGGGGYAAFARTYTYDLESGMTFQRSLTPYDTLLIQYKGGEHQFKIADIKRDYANMLLDDKLYQFQNQQIQNFDLDNDHYYDMEAVLVQNYLTRAEFRIRPIHELIPGYNPFATPSTETIKQETKPEVKQEPKQEEQEEPEEEQEEPKQSTLSKFWNKAKGAGISITGAVTGISETEEKGGTTGIIILLAVIIAGIFLYWIYNEWF